MKHKEKYRKAILITVVVLIIIGLQSLPVLFPRPVGSKTLENEDFIVYYQPSQEKGASEVFESINSKAGEIYRQMNFENKGPTKVYIYSKQWQLAIREAGIVTLAFAPPWHIGDSHNGNIMVVSPYTPVKVHTHDSILSAVLHEMVHSIVYRVNDDLSYFWDNGLATYIAGQNPEPGMVRAMEIPTISDMHTENGLKFGNMGGYAFSYNYIEYMDKTYGWQSVLDYASGKGSYEEIFKKTEEEIYNDWVQYINGN
jgi:hypothetical protein